jgi:hypothetical protein
MNYWPGTKIVKSTRNAFNWREDSSVILSSHDWKSAESARRQTIIQPKKKFTVYSKAQASK